jgi:hypothetical protein
VDGGKRRFGEAPGPEFGRRVLLPQAGWSGALGEAGSEEDAQAGSQTDPNCVVGERKENGSDGNAEDQADTGRDGLSGFAVRWFGDGANPTVGRGAS